MIIDPKQYKDCDTYIKARVSEYLCLFKHKVSYWNIVTYIFLKQSPLLEYYIFQSTQVSSQTNKAHIFN